MDLNPSILWKSLSIFLKEPFFILGHSSKQEYIWI